MADVCVFNVLTTNFCIKLESSTILSKKLSLKKGWKQVELVCGHVLSLTSLGPCSKLYLDVQRVRVVNFCPINNAFLAHRTYS